MTSKLHPEPLTAEEIGTIYDKCLYLLSSKGVKVDYPPALKILDKAGAAVDFDSQQVRFPKDIIEMALRSVPHSVTLTGSNERHDIILPHPSGLFYTRSNTGARSYINPDSNTYRDITLADVAEWAQLVEALDEISFCAFPTPRDMPEKTADIHALKALFENTSKHIMVQPYSLESVEYLFELALAAAGGAEALKKRPIVHMLSCSLSPLTFKALDAEVIIQSCRYGVPIGLACLPSAGGTAPITTAGTILLSGIEILAMLVMSQLIKPGTPVIGLPLFFTLDMVTGRSLQSSGESILGAAAAVQFIKEAFHIPTHTYGFGTDSHIPDGQSMIETILRGLLVSKAGCDILGGAGQLDVATAISPVQLIVDNTLTSILKQIISGVKVDDDTLAWREILDTVPGSHFLERPHTLRHCREALRTELFVSQPREVWSSAGSKDLYTRAADRYKELKKELQPQQLAEDVQREMNRIVKEADEHLIK